MPIKVVIRAYPDLAERIARRKAMIADTRFQIAGKGRGTKHSKATELDSAVD